ncbi:MAG: FG-GAP-like repeat-containing protein, partial [Saprospiraceae bacterium]|nr:FG-GAP-like repeat-containing protein [Saprospiraceae bacterium]
DVTDHDFGAYHSSVSYLVAPMELQDLIPKIKVPKFLFRNNGDLHFTDYSDQWGVNIPAFSNGAAYGDLDNDGDLDLVVNNINDQAFVFQNTLNSAEQKPNYLRIKLVGNTNNPDAYGAQVTIYWAGQKQAAEALSARGYSSTSENTLHFGLGAATQADSIIVRWNDKQTSKLTNVSANQTLTIKYGENAGQPFMLKYAGVVTPQNPAQWGLDYIHDEKDFVDFDIQRTLPHKFSQYGPGMSVGDANGDGLDDIYFSGSDKRDGTWLVQNKDGKFTQKSVSYKLDPDKKGEELGTLLFDADGDGDNDLYLVHGSDEYNAGSPSYQDVLCVNDGQGNFTPMPAALPAEVASGQCVKAVDFDGDGDLDLFVGGRVLPLAFPKADRSLLLRNDSKT